ncbi:hypothetical protein IT400_01785 [Candidatus Nomurabacteria bacterium]|nr:hypothetical protein [Candidatus Nomurabacteria bacterium]
MSQFDKPNENPKENTEETRPIGRAGDDIAPHSSDHIAPAVTPERGKEQGIEEEIIDALIKFDCYDPNTIKLLGDWEKALRDKLYLENTGKIKKESLDSFVHEEFQRLENELFNEALDGIHDEEKRQQLIRFIENKKHE